MSERHQNMLNPNSMPMLDNNGRTLIQFKPFVDSIGLDYEEECAKLEKDQLLSKGVHSVVVIRGNEMFRIYGIAPAELIAWMFRFDPNDYEGKVKEEILSFQELMLKFITGLIKHNDEEHDYE